MRRKRRIQLVWRESALKRVRCPLRPASRSKAGMPVHGPQHPLAKSASIAQETTIAHAMNPNTPHLRGCAFTTSHPIAAMADSHILRSEPADVHRGPFPARKRQGIMPLRGINNRPPERKNPRRHIRAWSPRPSLKGGPRCRPPCRKFLGCTSHARGRSCCRPSAAMRLEMLQRTASRSGHASMPTTGTFHNRCGPGSSTGCSPDRCRCVSSCAAQAQSERPCHRSLAAHLRASRIGLATALPTWRAP